jgi:hypothetical protein
MATTIPPGAQTYTPPSDLAEAAGGPSAGSARGTGGIDGLDLQKFFDDVMKVAGQYNQSTRTGDGSTLTDARGAPRIDVPSEAFSASDMTDLLRSIRSKSQDTQLKTSAQGIETARIKAEKNTQAQLEKIKEWIDKCKDAASQGALSKIFGWIGKIFAAVASIIAVVAAAAATVATGGAAAPLLAIAVIGAVSATMSLASAISQEFGGPEISINSLIQHTVGKFLTDVCGVDPKQAEKICNIVGGVMAMAMPLMLAVEPSLLGNMVQSIALMAGADEKTAGYIGMAVTMATAIGVGIALAVMTGGSSLATTGAQTVTQISNKVMAETIKVVNTVMSSTSAIVAGGTQIASGGLTISKGVIEEDAQKNLADKKELAAQMLKLQTQMEEGREEMKKVIQQIEDSTQVVSKMISDTSDSMSQIAMNMVGSKSTV